jgi:hypothetical protein
LFRTAKYRPEFPTKGFADVPEARRWASLFVTWYNNDHKHSGIRYVSPTQRHPGHDPGGRPTSPVHVHLKLLHPLR